MDDKTLTGRPIVNGDIYLNVMNIKILIATTKEYRFPKDPMYVPIQGGRAYCKEKALYGITGDESGDNISQKNATYCELTSLYWGWKNLDCDYMGLCHYRRLFGSPVRKSFNKWQRILNSAEAETLLEKAPLILPRKRDYFIESLYSHYGHTHYAADLKLTRKVLEMKFPGYLNSYDHMMNETSAHMFNMFIMRKDLINEYCEWLFDILNEVEKRLDMSTYSAYDRRAYGRISELLLDVWILENHIEYNEVPLLFMENPHWIRKIVCFLKAKYMSGKEL